jgi:hypothetical protein
MAAVGQLEPHDGLAGLEDRQVGSHVGLRAAVRLHVGVLGGEQLERPVNSQLLDLIDDLTAAVVPPAGISLGILVGEHRPHRLQYRPGDEVLAGDQLETVLLPLDLARDQPADGGISRIQWLHAVAHLTHFFFFFIPASAIRSSANLSAARYVGIRLSPAICTILRIVS